jgi:flagellar hook assembly protein FlgD
VSVFDVLGRRVKRLYADQTRTQVITVQWDGTNDRLERVPAGVYFIKALAAGLEGSTKVVIVH